MTEHFRLAGFALGVILVLYASWTLLWRESKGPLPRRFVVVFSIQVLVLIALGASSTFLEQGRRRSALRAVTREAELYSTDYDKLVELRAKEETLAASLNEPRKQIDALISLGQLQLDHENYPDARLSLSRALDLARRKTLREVLPRIYLTIGESYLGERRPAKAVESLQESYAAARTLGDENGLLKATLRLGDAAVDTKDWSHAAEYYSRAEQLASKANNRTDTFEALYGLGEAYRRAGQYDKAAHFFAQAKSVGDPRLASKALVGLGETLYAQNRRDEAISSFQQAAEPAADVPTRTEALRDMAGVYMDLGRWSQAEQVYTQLVRLGRDSNDKNIEAQATTSLATVARLQNNWSKAKADFAEAGRLYTEAGNIAAKKELLKTLVIIYSDHRDREALRDVQLELEALDRKEPSSKLEVGTVVR